MEVELREGETETALNQRIKLLDNKIQRRKQQKEGGGSRSLKRFDKLPRAFV